MSIGSRDVKSMIIMGKTALDSVTNYQSAIKQLKNGNRSYNTINNYLSANPYAPDKNQLINDYFTSLPSEEKQNKDAFSMFLHYVDNIDNPQFRYVINHRSEFEAKFGSDAIANKLFSLFLNCKDSTQYSYLMKVDPVLLKKTKISRDYYDAWNNFSRNDNDKTCWKNYVTSLVCFSENANIPVDEYNNICWFIFKNYRKFNDINTLRIAEQWSKKTIKEKPNNHLFNDTYAHIIFDLGNKEDAIKYEKIALKIAREEDSDQLNFYTKELIRFKENLD